VTRKLSGTGVEPAELGDREQTRDRLRRDLEARGVDPLFADAVMARVELTAESASGQSWDAIIDGVEVAYHVHRKGQENLKKNLRGLTEVSRLMEDFGSEIRKLDENLKTLAAYLARMRDQFRAERPGVLH
jgi:hypothetical protein